MEARIDDPKMKNKKHIVIVYLSGCVSDYVPKDRQIFAVTHRLLIEVRIIEPKMKNEKRISTVYLSGCAGNCAPKDRWTFTVSH